MQMPDTPPWQVRVTGFVTFWASLGGLGLWGLSGRASMPSQEPVCLRRSSSGMRETPEPLVRFTLKMIIAGGAAVVAIKSPGE